MNKKTALENLLFDSGLKIDEFAKKVNVPYETFKNQLYLQKHKHVQYAFDYGRKLGVSTIKGFADGVTFELIIK